MNKTFSRLAIIAAIASISGSAFALGDITNNGGAGGTAIANPIATGGTGLGVGVGLGGAATGGSVLGSGNSASSSGVIGSGNSANTNVMGQQQGQNQGQIATGGKANSSSASTSGATSNSGGNTFATGNTSQSTAVTTGATSQNVSTGATSQAVSTGATSQSNAGNNSSVNVQGDSVVYEAQKRAPVASAWAAPLAASNGTCLGSASGGLQTVGVGLSFGKTTLDEGCDARYDAIALTQIGEGNAARERLCLKPEIAEAFARSGKPCASSKASAPREVAAVNEPSDPYVRRRMGLSPL